MKHFNFIFFKYSICIAFFALISSCSKEKAQEIYPESTNVEIVVSGIVDQLFQTNASAKSSKLHQNNFASITEEEFDDFSWALSIENQNDNSNLKDKLNTLSNSKSYKKNAATIKMLAGKKFRIIFYEVSNGKEIYRESAEITVSAERYLLKLNTGITYNWYAYSYDDANTIPLPTNLNNPEIITRTDAPFLFDSGSCTVGAAGGTRVNIAFKHQITKVEVKVDATEVFANSFTSLQAKFNNLNVTTKSFSLKQGVLGAQVVSTTVLDNNISFVDDEFPNIKKSTNVVYTADLNNIPVIFSNIVINKSGSSVALVNSSTGAKSANVIGYSTDATKIKRAVIKLKYKGGVIGNNEWAQGILYYDTTDPSNPYKISEPFMSGTVHSCNYYWSFNTLLPKSQAGNSLSPSGDPCREVLPKNTWRTPSTSDFASLNIANPNSPKNGAVYFQANNGERVYFHEAGWITGTNCNVANDNDGLYWSTNERNTTRAYVLEIDERGGTGAGNEVIDYPKTYGMTIKCIRSY